MTYNVFGGTLNLSQSINLIFNLNSVLLMTSSKRDCLLTTFTDINFDKRLLTM